MTSREQADLDRWRSLVALFDAGLIDASQSESIDLLRKCIELREAINSKLASIHSAKKKAGEASK